MFLCFVPKKIDMSKESQEDSEIMMPIWSARCSADTGVWQVERGRGGDGHRIPSLRRDSPL